ncbi:MAG TPA: SPASM domain-containing protein [Nitrospira sp.]|nr:SPASM domain-containing protein [Nitrospira sp.]
MVSAAIQLRTSRYNFHVPVEDGAILYNTRTAALLQFRGPDALTLTKSLCAIDTSIPPGALTAEVVETLRKGGFIIAHRFDEVAEIRRLFQHARHETPMVLTLTTTMDCNLGCYYCYEQRSAHHLTYAELPAILELVRTRLARSHKQALHVDWYGGEPLMNLAFMEQASRELQTLCEHLSVAYTASIISNGTCWPEDVNEFIARHRLTQVQISFDGLAENHNRRRHFRKGYSATDDLSSFHRAVQLVDQLLDHVRVDLRLNIDHGNIVDVLPFIQWARKRGWFARAFPAVIQPARLASYSHSSEFMREVELSVSEFNQIQAAIRDSVSTFARLEESEAPDGFPYPRTSVCAALADDSVVIGADGLHYRCGLQVGETHRAVGTMQNPEKKSLPMFTPASTQHAKAYEWWKDFDPTTLPNCKRCSFLPICWGGCPKRHLENDHHALAEQGAYWRTNLARMIGTVAGMEPSPAFVYTEQDQFRV